MSLQLKDVSFALHRIVTTQFAILDEMLQADTEILMNTTVNFGLGAAERIVGIKGVFQFEADNKVFIKLEVCCEFVIDQSAWAQFILEDKQHILFPRGLMTHLTTLLVGTARGILHSKTENTPYNKFILPTINVTELVINDVQMDLFAQPTAP